MSIYKFKEYHLVSDIKFKAMCVSDIHLNKTSIKRIFKTLEVINTINPDYLFIPGDIIDNRDELKNKNNIKKLIEFFNSINKNIQVIYVYGNHDFDDIDEKNKDIFKETFDEIKKLENIHFVDKDKIYEDERIIVAGVNLPIEYYTCDGLNEDKQLFINELKNVDKKKFINNKKRRILLIHSPLGFENNETKEYLNLFDTVYTGHMHNGAVPFILDDIFKGNHGFVSPKKKLITNYARNMMFNKLIINGAITPVSNVHNPITLLYPIHLSLVIYDKDDKKKEYYKIY